MGLRQRHGLEIAEALLLGIAVIALGVTIALGQWIWVAIALVLCLGIGWLNRLRERRQTRKQIRALKQQQLRLAAEQTNIAGELPHGAIAPSDLPTLQQWRALQQTVKTLDLSLNQLRQSVSPPAFESRLEQVEALYQQLQLSVATSGAAVAPALAVPDSESSNSASSNSAIASKVPVPHWQARHAIAGHDKRVSALAFSLDGSKLLSGSWDRSLKLWDLARGQCLGAEVAHSQGIQAVLWAGDRTLVSGSYDRSIKIWSWQELDGEIALNLEATLSDHLGSIHSLAIADDGQWLLSGSYDGTLKRWDIAERKLLDSRFDELGAIAAVAVDPRGRWVASAGGDGRVSLWQIANSDRILVLEGNFSSVVALAIDAEGQTLAAGCVDGTIKLWSIPELTHPTSPVLPMRTIAAHRGTVTCLCFNAEDRTLMSAGIEGLIEIWHPSSTEAIAVLAMPVADASRNCGIFSLLLTPDCRWLVAGGDDGTIQVWENG